MVTKDLETDSSNRESGQIVILTAVAMVALLGIAALSLDASFMYDKRNRLHAAADAAAKSAAIEVVRNPTVSQASLEAFADEQVKAHGFTPSRLAGGTTIVTIHHPPISEPFAGNVYYVEAIVSESTATFFARVLGLASMTPGASAIAGAGNPANCLIVDEDLSIGRTTLTMNGCGVAVGRDLLGTNPTALITGIPSPSVAVTGTWNGTGTMGSLTTGAPTPTDPLAGLAAPPPIGVGCPAGIPATTTTLSAGCYTSIPNTVTTLNPGIYYVTGTLDIGNLTGTGVMIYLTGGGHITSNNSANSLNLVAPTSGPYTGIAIFQDPTNSNNFDTGNHFTLNVTGAIYMPGTDVNIRNHLDFANTTCTLFIARSLIIENGNGTVSNTGCASTFGGAAFLTVSIAK